MTVIGDISEYMLDRMIDEMLDPFFGEPVPVDYSIWYNKDGRSFKVGEMTDVHLNNTIRFLRRGNSPLKDGYIKSMSFELERRKKMNLGKYNIAWISGPIQSAPVSIPHGLQEEQPKIINVDLKVVGVTFSNEDGSSRREAIMEMDKSTSITLVREPENKYDPNAIKVIAGNKQIGYIGKDYASIMASMMDKGSQFTAVVKDCGEFKSRPYCEITVNQL